MAPRALITRTLAFCFGIAGTVLALECTLRLLPVINGTFAADPRSSWPVHTMIPNTRYTYSTGWNLQNIHHGRINNFGYAAPHDYSPGSGGIAILGDSYMESLMNAYPDTVPGALNEYLDTDQVVLNFGMSGAEMPDYLGMAPLVRDTFRPDWAVVVINVGDFTRGFSAAPGYYEWHAGSTPPVRLRPEIVRSKASKLFRTFAIVRYLRGNLSMRPGALVQLQRAVEPPGTASACKEELLSNADEALLEAYARELPGALGLAPAKVILVFDADRRGIYAGRTAEELRQCRSRATQANDRLKDLAAAGGMHVIDSHPVFSRHFQAGRGALDRSPVDAHWNPAAHHLMAREVARIIEP